MNVRAVLDYILTTRAAIQEHTRDPSHPTRTHTTPQHNHIFTKPKRSQKTKAYRKIAKYCNSIRPLYASASTVRTPNVDVEINGIAGGQRTILDKELIDCGQPELIPKVDTEILKVRTVQ